MASTLFNQKLLKVCQAFSANLYQFPENSAIAEKRFNVQTQILKDKVSAINAVKDYLRGGGRFDTVATRWLKLLD